MINGFSPALLKVFMGEQEEKEEDWEVTDADASTLAMAEEEDEFNPFNVMKKALLRKTFDGLVIVD